MTQQAEAGERGAASDIEFQRPCRVAAIRACRHAPSAVNISGMEPPDPAAVELAAAHFLELATLARLGSVRILMSRTPDGGLRPAEPRMQSPTNWIDDHRAQHLYNSLRELEIEVYCEGLLRAAHPEESRRKVLAVAIRIGRSYSEADLVRLLRRYGTRAICSDYLNCESKYLADEAAEWARKNGFVVRTFGLGKAATWGAF